jgi:DNA polymerase-3 subunit beta
VQFETQDCTLVSRVLDGQFPNYEKVIPKAVERKITFDRGEFSAPRAAFSSWPSRIPKRQSSLPRAIARNDRRKPGSRSRLRRSADFDGRREPHHRVQHALSHRRHWASSPTEQATLELSGALNPGILRAGGQGDFLYVVMPMQA